ncbi:dihydrolipoyl dehydrogenase [Candidatus Bathyarchaeota archaeon]|nr:dihydrolipoyl dehydrogenase [Candidatus Bathyarchaeota archaeon]
MREKIRRAKDYGILIGSFSVDLKGVKAKKEAIVDRLSQGVRYLLEKNKVDFIEGVGRIKSRNRIVVERNGEERIVNAKNIIIASGSRPRQLPNILADGIKIITAEDVLGLEEVPENIFIIGGGILGVEFAQIFRSLGANVTILEKRQNLLPNLDKEVGTTFRRILERNGIKIFTRVSSELASVKNDKVNLTFQADGGKVDATADKVIVTVGRIPNIEDLGLENIGVRLKDGFIEVDRRMRTNVPNIYAVGDVIGGKMFAHAALAEGLVAAENIAGLEREIEWRTIPVCIYTTPEIASVGLTEEEAANLGYKISVGKFPFMANGRALALGEREGFVKVIASKETDEILGVHIIGPDASNMISEATVAIRLECTSEELGRIIHPHPTLSETIMEAALAVFGRAIHV